MKDILHFSATTHLTISKRAVLPLNSRVPSLFIFILMLVLSATPSVVKGLSHVAEYEQHLNFPQLMVVIERVIVDCC